jgi:hypothetical protein
MKKQKMPAENFSFQASCTARTVQPEKFVRPDLSRTGILCYGIAGWNAKTVKILINNTLQNNVNGSLSKDLVKGLARRFDKLKVTNSNRITTCNTAS